MRVPVVIVGAGPVGLAMGLLLARYQIPSIILDDEGPMIEGSRAICIERHTLEIFDRLDVAAPMLAKGVTWSVGRVFYGERELFQFEFPAAGENQIPRFINLQQYYTEQYLVDGVQRQKLCDLRWHHRVLGLRQDDRGATIAPETPSGAIQIEADYVLAADGAKSTVRKLLEIPFAGASYADRFLICDIRADLPFPRERWFWFDPPFHQGRSALIHPQPDNVWRIDWQLGPDADAERERQPEALDRRIRAMIGGKPYEVVWPTVYTFHQRCADRFRKGRVFLLGDAAHLVAPFGARGMNSGVQDANNLAWKLWLVMSGMAPQALLGTYETERRAAALENLRITDETMAFISPQGVWPRWRRDWILRGSVHFKSLRKWVNSGRLSEPFHCRKSPIIDERGGGVAPASALEGIGFTAICFGQKPRDAGLNLPCAVRVEDPGSPLAQAMGAKTGTLCVVRPDGHIAVWIDDAARVALQDVLNFAIGA
jgi:3-(3-hydroxy-phenyl)propionate hydroxylase